MLARKIARRYINLISIFSKLLALSLILAALYLVSRYLFTISIIDCRQEADNCPQPIVAELSHSLGANLLFFDENLVRSKILGANPNLESVQFTPSLPGKLFVELKPSPLIAQVQVTPNLYLLISQQLKVVDSSPRQLNSLPAIIPVNQPNINLGDNITDSDLVATFTAITLLKKSFIPVKKVHIESSRLIRLELPNTADVLVNPRTDLSQKIKLLELLISNSSKVPPGHLIDLRFQNPLFVDPSVDASPSAVATPSAI